MDWGSMSNEENYCFDVAGYLHVPGVLTREEIDVLYQRLDKNEQAQGMLSWPKAEREPFRNLLIHPRLVWYLNQIIGSGVRLDQEPTWISNATNQVITPLAGGDEPQDPARTYYFQNGRRYCQSVRAIWALADVEKGDGGFVMVPAMIYLLGMPTSVVVGTSLFQIVFVTANVTLLQAINNQTVDIVLALLLLVGGVIGAQLGAIFGARLKGEQLRVLLGLIALAVCGGVAYNLIVDPADLFSLAGVGGAR